jgi:hypothetical protein
LVDHLPVEWIGRPSFDPELACINESIAMATILDIEELVSLVVEDGLRLATVLGRKDESWFHECL